MNSQATYKVGLNKGRLRIWIDGKRLLDAGFTPGTRYTCQATEGFMALAIDGVDLATDPGRLTCLSVRKVSGRPGGKPIIDITGADAALAFTGCSRVSASFYDGVIELLGVV